MRVLWATLALSLMFFGCSKSEDKDSQIAKWVKELNDQGTMMEYTKEDIQDFFKGEDVFLALHNTIEGWTNDSYLKCILDSQFSNVKISADKNTIQYTIDFDGSDCLKSSIMENSEVTVNTVKGTVFTHYMYYCETADYSSYTGKNLKTLLEDHPYDLFPCNEGKVKFIKYNSFYENLDFTATDEKTNNKVNYKTELQGYFAQLNPTTKEACEGNASNGVITWQDGCTIYAKTYFIKNQSDDTDEGTSLEGKTDYQKYVMKNNVKAPTSLPQGYQEAWYSGGEFEVFINGWKGKVVFSSATTAPTYEVTKDGETVTGTITGVNIQD